VDGSIYTIHQLAAECDAHGSCKAITSEGYMKYGVLPQTQWEEVTTSTFDLYSLCVGTWIKNSDTAECVPNGCRNVCDIEHLGYRFFPNKDSNGGDMLDGRTDGYEHIDGHSGSTHISDLVSICDSEGSGKYPAGSCLGFNADGWFKYSIRNAQDWPTFDSSSVSQVEGGVCKGLYVKTAVLTGASLGAYNCNVDGYIHYPYRYPGYTVRGSKGSSSIKISTGTNSPPSLANECSNTYSNCLGFTTEPWLVTAIDYNWDWTWNTGGDRCSGLYARQSVCSHTILSNGGSCGYCGGGSRLSGYCYNDYNCCSNGSCCNMCDVLFGLISVCW
jgi:hypothetical protein